MSIVKTLRDAFHKLLQKQANKKNKNRPWEGAVFMFGGLDF